MLTKEDYDQLLVDLGPWLTPRALRWIDWKADEFVSEEDARIDVGSYWVGPAEETEQFRSLTGTKVCTLQGYGVYAYDYEGEPKWPHLSFHNLLLEAVLMAFAMELSQQSNWCTAGCEQPICDPTI